MEYLDFIIRIESRRGEVFAVGIQSPAGEGSSELRLPFPPDQFAAQISALGRAMRGTREVVVEPGAPAAPPPSDLGNVLFQSLFTGACRDLFNTSIGQVQGRGVGLRIKLHIDPTEPDIADLASLPWELMYRSETRDYLSLSRGTPLVRYLDVQRPFTLLPYTPPLRILIVVSSPAGVPPLDLADERRAIEASWGHAQGVEVDFLSQATSLRLCDRLAATPYHVLHFMGHGDFDAANGTGVLLLEDEAGMAAPMDGATLGMLLRDAPSMRLVFLNACNTAQASRRAGLDPFAGVANALVMAGVPAVVAMQFPISDSAAIEFASTFYPRLVEGFPIDAAVAEARKAIRMADGTSWEWATPVLFMRSRDGALFAPPAASQPTTSATTGAALPASQLADRVQAMQTLSSTFAPERYTILGLIVVSVLVFLLGGWKLFQVNAAAATSQATLLSVTGGAGSAALFLVSRLLKINERTVALLRELSLPSGGAH
ncbi:MAG: CHAT domain-containing protein [Gemmatimonadota bacterium]